MSHHPHMIIGWKEVVSLPDLKIELCAKIDTGARTSALHATQIEFFEREGRPWVRFLTAHEQLVNTTAISCEAPLHGHREVKSSNGEEQIRPVIKTHLEMGEFRESIHLTLVDRSSMKYPMLLGRRAMERHIWVAPGAAYLLGQP